MQISTSDNTQASTPLGLTGVATPANKQIKSLERLHHWQHKAFDQYVQFLPQLAEALWLPIEAMKPEAKALHALLKQAPYRITDLYVGGDALTSSLHQWQNNDTSQSAFKRFWPAFANGSAVWLFQQLVGVYVPANLVAGMRKGSYTALTQPTFTSTLMANKKGLDYLFSLLQYTTQVVGYGTTKGLQKAIAVNPITKGLTPEKLQMVLPTMLALMSIPLIYTPVQRASQWVVKHVISPLLNRLGQWINQLIDSNTPETIEVKMSVLPDSPTTPVPNPAQRFEKNAAFSAFSE